MVKQKRWSDIVRRLLFYISLLAVLAFTILPFLWMISVSIKPREEVFTSPPRWIPDQPTLDAFRRVLSDSSLYARGVGFDKWVKNSASVTLAVTGLSLVLSTIAAYALSRFRFRGRHAAGYLILATQMVPSVVLMIPLHIMMRDAKLLDTLTALVICYSTFAMPFCTWMMRGYFNTIPTDLDEAAMVDGATRLGALFRVVVPLALPGFVATGIFTFILAWNEFLLANVMISSPGKYTLPVALASFRGQYVIPWNLVMAACVLISIPTLLLFALLQRSLVAGFTAGAVKGQ